MSGHRRDGRHRDGSPSRHRLCRSRPEPFTPTLPAARHLEDRIDIAVLASGSGTNLQALIDHPRLRPHITLVVSEREDAHALRRAEASGIPTAVVRWSDHPDRDSFSEAIADLVEGSGAKGVVLAGFMRILSATFIDRFRDRVLNLHPSLLPSYPGVRAVEQALEDGAKVTGVTVHFVDEEVDHGPIVTQRQVAVREDDTPESLHARIKAIEHGVYPQVVEAFVAGALRIEGEEVVWS